MPGTDRPSFGNAVVPLDPGGEVIDEVRYRAMLRYMSDAGTAVFVGGPHATEFVSMDDAERRRLWELAVDELSGRGPIFAIVFGPASTTEMIRRFRLARELGFDGAQLYPGAEGGRGGDGLYVAEAERYFRDVLEAVEMPIYLCGYHGGEIIDSPNHQVPHQLVLDLMADYPHIAGVTVDGAGDQDALAAFCAAVGGRRPVRVASALDWFATMERGVYGFHSIQQSIAPRLCATMMEAFHAGDKERARELSATIKQLNEIVHTPRYHYPRTLKPILSHLGFEMGAIRRPYLEPPADQVEEMCRRIDELDLGRFEDLPA